MDRDSFKLALTQTLIQLGLVAVLALSALALGSCARKNTTPPGARGHLTAEQLEELAQQKAEAEGSDSPVAQVTAQKIKNGSKLVALILKDQKMAAYRAQYERKNDVVCTRASAKQMHWECASATICKFTVEFTCVSNVGEFKDNNEVRRLILMGEANTTQLTYRIQDPAKTAMGSLPSRVNFNF